MKDLLFFDVPITIVFDIHHNFNTYIYIVVNYCTISDDVIDVFMCKCVFLLIS